MTGEGHERNILHVGSDRLASSDLVNRCVEKGRGRSRAGCVFHSSANGNVVVEEGPVGKGEPGAGGKRKYIRRTLCQEDLRQICSSDRSEQRVFGRCRQDRTHSGWNWAAQMYLPLSFELLMPSTLESWETIVRIGRRIDKEEAQLTFALMNHGSQPLGKGSTSLSAY